VLLEEINMEEIVRIMKENMKNLKYPKGERVWESYYNESRELKFIITSKTIRDSYFLYELVDGEFKKLGKAKTPPELVEKYDVEKKIGVVRV
jgi:hypothetical protein